MFHYLPRRSILIVFVAFCCINLLYAQSGFLSGYIIRNSGDITKGYIRYYRWDKSPSTVQFSASPDGNNPSNFTPNVIREFGLYHSNYQTEAYRSFNMLVEQSSQNIQTYSTQSQPIYSQYNTLLFGLLLTKGKISLYKLAKTQPVPKTEHL